MLFPETVISLMEVMVSLLKFLHASKPRTYHQFLFVSPGVHNVFRQQIYCCLSVYPQQFEGDLLLKNPQTRKLVNRPKHGCQSEHLFATFETSKTVAGFWRLCMGCDVPRRMPYVASHFPFKHTKTNLCV